MGCLHGQRAARSELDPGAGDDQLEGSILNVPEPGPPCTPLSLTDTSASLDKRDRDQRGRLDVLVDAAAPDVDIGAGPAGRRRRDWKPVPRSCVAGSRRRPLPAMMAPVS